METGEKIKFDFEPELKEKPVEGGSYNKNGSKKEKKKDE